ncbi:hypothetical protein FA10DRAFT_95434 [Acaromyces ingoldii]|uniref:RNI-like protein n=1 Tax=Acaromyces ingoldii TaxID=215250 RepID=A0A316YXL4_9BASI|nr:hypothetical protein FA10DRAFT_95434 [Acaromyces ingoldii]PWN92555.1 hypothetical protein FA10DRAFT_95434 [Acaromyces ingoldii]
MSSHGPTMEERERALTALIPSLARRPAPDDGQRGAGDGSQRLAARLAKMRIEDRRRLRNLEGRASSSSSLLQQQPGSSSVVGGAFPGSETLALMGDEERATRRQREQEALARRRNVLRSRFAGPLPPGSWLDEEPPRPGTPERKEQNQGWDQRRKRALSRSVRHMLGDGDGRLPSLVDAALLAIVDDASSGAEADLEWIPPHLQPRLMALSGRLAQGRPLTDAVLRRLLPPSLHSLEEQVEHERGSSSRADSWEDDEAPLSRSTTRATGSRLLDLSFSSASHATLSRLLGVHLRILSLAGSELIKGDGPASRTVALVAGACPQLEQLSLAGLETSSGLALLRKLCRATPRLASLDLSHCDWVDGTLVACLFSEHSAWPRLQSLYLVGCASFYGHEQLAAHDSTAAELALQPSPLFVGPWHAHHAANSRRRRQAKSRAQAQGTGWEEGPGSSSSSSSSSRSPASSSYPTRCTVTGKRVEAHQWERARALDAVSCSAPRDRAMFCQVYF